MPLCVTFDDCRFGKYFLIRCTVAVAERVVLDVITGVYQFVYQQCLDCGFVAFACRYRIAACTQIINQIISVYQDFALVRRVDRKHRCRLCVQNIVDQRFRKISIAQVMA